MTIDQLIKLLERAYPNKIPTDLKTPIEHLRVLQGRQEVIAYIRNINDDPGEYVSS